MKKKILSILLAVSLVCSNFTVLATDVGTETGIEALADYTGAPAEVIVGGTTQLSTQIKSQWGYTIAWSSDTPGVVTVDNNGKISGVAEGNAIVTVTKTGDWTGNVADTETFAITVLSKTFVGDPVSVEVGASTEALSTDGLTGTITWTTGNKEIATVVDGVVTGISVGETTVTAIDGRGRTKTFEVNVTEVVVEEENPKVYVMLDKTKTISTEDFDLVAPIKWESEDSTIVSVDQEGKVTGNKNLEKTTVTATDANNTVVTFEVHVTELQYFNTNVFDYKEGSKGTLIKKEQKEFDALTGSGVYYLTAEDLKDPTSGWGSIGIDQCGACVKDSAKDAGIGTLPYKDDANFVVTYKKGITMHADGSATVTVPEGATQFTAVAAVNKCQTSANSSMTFRVTKLDVTGQAIGNPIKYVVGNGDMFESRAQMVDVDVTGAASIKLEVLKETEVEGSNETNANDHGLWADAKFTVEKIDQNERMGTKTVYDESTSFNSINDYTYEKNNTTSEGLYFTGGENKGNYSIFGTQNYWTGSAGFPNGVVKDIVNPELKGSNIQFKFTEPGIFTMESNNAKDVFTNVKFPYVLDADGYYTFDSKEMDAAFTDGIGVNGATMEWYDGSAKYSRVTQSDGDKTGFFPFEDTKGAAEYTKWDLNYWFGMNQAVDFYMLNGGYIDKAKTEPIVFEFSGDDDVWVYVDGKLVLDMGGIHNRAEGKIDFGNRKITITPPNGKVENIELDSILGADWGTTSDEELHSLEVFYLERGKGASNLKVRFNLPQRDQLVVEKVFDNTGANAEEQVELLNREFTYRITCDGQAFTGEHSYVLKEHGSIIERNLHTDKNGRFVLKYGQQAVFTLEMPRPKEHTYQVEEIFAEPYFTTTWELKQNKKELGRGEGKEADPVSIGIKNEYDRKNVDIYTYTFHNYRDTVLADDTVVIDYGKKIPINVFANDALYTKREMKLDASTNKNGTFAVNKENVDFIPNAFMDEIETTNYSVVDAKNETKSAKVTVIPATTVYYEDDFAEDNNGIKYTDNWRTVKDNPASDEVEREYQDDGTVGEDAPYGQDSSYVEDGQFSGGSAKVAEGKVYKDENGKLVFEANAGFEFKGTGFDLISRTDKECGMITVKVQKKDAATGEWGKAKNISVLNKGENTLYQIPVITYHTEEYGEYKVTINIREEDVLMGYGPKFYLDAIRIYNPMGSDAEANEAYKQDNEANAQFISLRDKLITESTEGIGVTLDSSYTDGMVWVDSLGIINDNTDNNTINLETYRTVGPNREVYLSPQCAIAFQLTVDKKPASVQVGAKAPKNGITNWVAASTNNTSSILGEITTATDMYYDVTDGINWELTEDGKFTATIYIANTSDVTEVDNILSLTNLKLTYAEKAAEPIMQSNVTVVREVLACMLAQEDTYVPSYEITYAAFAADKVGVNKEATIVVKTSKDVERLVLLDKKGKVVELVSVESTVDKSLVGTEQNDVAKTWKVVVKPDKTGKLKYKIYGVSADNITSEEKVEVSTKVVPFTSIKDIFDPWF